MKTLNKDGNFQQFFAFFCFPGGRTTTQRYFPQTHKFAITLSPKYIKPKSHKESILYIFFCSCLNKIVGAWKKTLPTLLGNYGRNYVDRPTNQPSDRRTDRVIGKFH